MLKWIRFLIFCLCSNLYGIDSSPPNEPFLFQCDSLKKLYIPELYKWIRNSQNVGEVDRVIKTLDSIPYERKIARLQKFCLARQLDGVKVRDRHLMSELLDGLFYKSEGSLFFEDSEQIADDQVFIPYNYNIPNYSPVDNQPEISWAYENKDLGRSVFISKTREAPLQWQETCLSMAKDESVAFEDCYASQRTVLNLNFEANTSHFQIRHGEKCLSKDTDLQWLACDAEDKNQYFVRETPFQNKAGTYLKYNLRHISSQDILWDEEFVHIRDTFPLLSIGEPMLLRKSADQIDSFFKQNTFTAERRPPIVLVWIDTLRADVITPSTMPNLYEFAKQGVSFEQNFSSGTSTRPTGYSVWNSRPATEWAYALRHEFHQKAGINTRILEKLGYSVHAIGSELAPLEEKIFHENGNMWDEENPENIHFLHRNLFSFRVPKEERYIDPSCTLGDDEYGRISHVLKDQKALECFRHQVEKKPSRPQAYFIWQFGGHNPYIPLPEFTGNLRFPSFNPYQEDSFRSVQHPLWHLWQDYGMSHQEALINSYLNLASSVDFLFAQTLQTLKDTGIYDKAIVIVMSDHGESLFENATVGHGQAAHQKVIESFIFYHFPKDISVPEILTKVGSHSDIFPTVFDVMGVKVHSRTEQSLETMHVGQSIFKTGGDCKISVSPNGYGYQAVEFALYNGSEKLRARFRQKERDLNQLKAEENPLGSREIEVIAYTDYWDRPLESSSNEAELVQTLEKQFGKCFTENFGERTALVIREEQDEFQSDESLPLSNFLYKFMSFFTAPFGAWKS